MVRMVVPGLEGWTDKVDANVPGERRRALRERSVTPVVVFLGPTLSEDEARAVLDAEYMPPAGHGDVLRAALRRPRVIAIVDGVFERTPAVWHKEILFALSEGIHVYGAASMGALRAAELDRFGMRGVGDVYRAYADGVLEDDDEVAVAHADAEHGFRALSDSMVDVRATLETAVARRGGRGADRRGDRGAGQGDVLRGARAPRRPRSRGRGARAAARLAPGGLGATQA